MLAGIEVRLNEDFFSNREKYENIAKNIIYTGPIDKFFNYEFGKLEYRTVEFETKVLDSSNYQGNAVVNYTDYDIPYTRIIEHKHFEFDTTSPKTVISLEYSKEWNSNMEPYYPINNDRNNALFNEYNEMAKKISNVHFGGRLGQYKYYDMDKVILEALSFINSINK